MAVCDNPYYDPAWETRLARAEARLARMDVAAEGEVARTGFGSAAHRAALHHHAEALAEVRAARRASHQSIADYASAAFASVGGTADGFVVLPDFEAFTSIEEVDAAVERARRQAKLGVLAENSVLPTRQPPGLGAFSHGARVVSSWRRFGAGREIVDCLISFDEWGGDYHFCLTQCWPRLGAFSNEIFVRIATQLAREGLEFLHPGAARLFAHDQHRMAANLALIREVNRLARQFHFYRHSLADDGLKESFTRVPMRWEGAYFLEPDWEGALYASLPEALRETLNLPPLPAPGKNLPVSISIN
jgi:hypothetical protein